MKLYICKTKSGFCGVVFSGKYLVASCLPQMSKQKVIKKIKRLVNDFSIFENKKNICLDLIKYFEGKKINFNKYKIAFVNLTEFQKKVLKKVRKVEYGKTITYKQLAEKIGDKNAYRAVGNALSKNKLPIIVPCHRVLKSNGDIGKYSGGKSLKKFLLQLENVDF